MSMRSKLGLLMLGCWFGAAAVCFPAVDAIAQPPEMSAATAEAEESGPRNTPRQILELWLRYHETEMCQETDAVFVFHPKGAEIWCEAADDKGCQKIVDMFSTLQASYQIDFYVTRPTAARKREEEKDPPPSLWNNAELLRYLKDPFNSALAVDNRMPRRDGDSGRNEFLKQRLLMYAEQIQNWNQRMKRYGTEMPTLAKAGFGPDFPPDLRKRAVAVCLAHVQAVDKYAARLADSLGQALPRSAKNSDDKARATEPRHRSTTIEIAAQLSAKVKVISRSINGFLFPQHHTVEIADLREPGLLDSLRLLRELSANFQAAAAAAR